MSLCGTLRWGVHPLNHNKKRHTEATGQGGSGMVVPKGRSTILRGVCRGFWREASKRVRYRTYLIFRSSLLARTSLRGCLSGYAQPIVVTPLCTGEGDSGIEWHAPIPAWEPGAGWSQDSILLGRGNAASGYKPPYSKVVTFTAPFDSM